MFDSVMHRLSPFAQEFSRHGKQIFLVGGAVRNLLLGLPVKDYDFTTDALPSEVQVLFRKVLPTGIQHGTVTVLFQGQSFEVTTFRVDGDYSDGRRPDGVIFTPSLEEDLKRRDFTINAIALNLSTGALIDPHGGQGDLKNRLIRAIGDPVQRFDEDALRILRLFRFSSQLDFSIDDATQKAAQSRQDRLSTVSRERVREELGKAMAGGKPQRAWEPLSQMGILADCFPDLAPVSLSPPALEHLERVSPDLRWSFWLTLACGPSQREWERALKKLTFSNSDIASYLGPTKALEFLKSSRLDTGAAKALIEIWGSRDRVLPGLEYLLALEERGLWTDTTGFKAELERSASSGEPIFLGELAVDGKQLMHNGIAAGPRLGQILKSLLAEVWADPSLNSTESLLQRAHQLL